MDGFGKDLPAALTHFTFSELLAQLFVRRWAHGVSSLRLRPCRGLGEAGLNGCLFLLWRQFDSLGGGQFLGAYSLHDHRHSFQIHADPGVLAVVGLLAEEDFVYAADARAAL